MDRRTKVHSVGNSLNAGAVVDLKSKAKDKTAKLHPIIPSGIWKLKDSQTRGTNGGANLDNAVYAVDLKDIGDRSPTWAAWCIASRSPPHADEPKVIKMIGSPYYGHTLNPCDMLWGVCKRHGFLNGSLNEVATNGTEFDFDDCDLFGFGTFELDGKDIVDAQSAMMISRERSRQGFKRYSEGIEDDEQFEPRRKAEVLPEPKCHLKFPAGHKCALCKDYVDVRIKATYTTRQRNLAARAHRVACAKKEESKYFSGGKYQRLTLMGLPAEIHALIFKHFFRNLHLEGKVAPKPNWGSLRPYVQPLKGVLNGEENIMHPLALLKTSRLFYMEGVRIFQENAMFCSEFEPAITTGVQNYVQTFRWSDDLPKPWPNVKRWNLRIRFPDDPIKPDNSGLVFPWYFIYNLKTILPSVITYHLNAVFKTVKTLDELIVDLGPWTSATNMLGEWALKFSRFHVMKGLGPFAGRVKKMRFIGYFPPCLNQHARLAEIHVQGYIDEKLGCLEKVYLPPTGGPADPANDSEEEQDADDDQDNQDDEDAVELNDEDSEETSTVITESSSGTQDAIANEFIQHMHDALDSWTKEQELTATTEPEQFIPIIPSEGSVESWFYSSNNPRVSFDVISSSSTWLWHMYGLEFPRQVYGVGTVLLAITNTATLQFEAEGVPMVAVEMPSGPEDCAWISIAPLKTLQTGETITPPQRNGPDFLTWPNSTLEAAAAVPVPEEIHLPMIYIPNQGRPVMDFFINIEVGVVMIVDEYTFPTPDSEGILPPEWKHIKIADFGLLKPGVYGLCGINGFPYENPLGLSKAYIKVLADCIEEGLIDAFELGPYLPGAENSNFSVDEWITEEVKQSLDRAAAKKNARKNAIDKGEISDTVSEAKSDMSIDYPDNLNPYYDGPEDDGLGWLDDEEAFDVEAGERLVGEMKLEDVPDWVPLSKEMLEALRIGVAR